jgi:hypothetical protein
MDYVVPEAKVVNYLLTSPKKSGFFLPLGYSIENWTKLRDHLLIVANNYPHVFRRTTPHGDEYEIVGEVHAPKGRTIRIRTGWMLRENAEEIMFFVTAYPA